MESASKITQDVIARARRMRSFSVKVQVEPGWLPQGQVPYDIHIQGPVATLTIIAQDLTSAQRLALAYTQSDQLLD